MLFKRCRNKVLIQALLVVFIFGCLLMYYCSPALKQFSLYNNSPKTELLSVSTLHDQSFYEFNCFDGKLERSLAQLPNNLERWSKAYHRQCQILWRKFHTIYKVNVREGSLNFPLPFVKKVRQWLGGNEDLMKEAYNQEVLQVNNHYTHEQTIFNLLRSKRPISNSKQDPLEYVDKLNNETRETCDFCHYKTNTAEDTFGRIESHSSVSASNVFKLEKWHGLFLSRKHSPIDLNEEEFVDLFNTSVKWFKKANAIDRDSCFPMMIYDTLPKGGASQFHPHVHGFLSTEYLSHMKVQSEASLNYKDDNDSDYWNDIIELHHALGLTVRLGNAIAFSPLTPVREHEIIILSSEPNTDIFRLFYYVIQSYYHKVRRMCFSSGIAYPVMCPTMNKASLPAVIRIGTRGHCNSFTNDVSSLELYLMQNVHVDPYVIIKYLQTTVDKLKGTTLLTDMKIVKLEE